MKNNYITEISLDDFLKLGLKGYRREWFNQVLVWQEYDLNKVVQDNFKYLETEKWLPGENIVVAIHKNWNKATQNSFDSDFYTAVDPSAVVISVGKNNYGHPDKKLLSYWQKAQIPCYRTDLNGAVTVTSNGKGYEITTYR